MRAEDSWIDVSTTLHGGMVHWPDNPPVHKERMLDIERGKVAIGDVKGLERPD